MIAERYQSLRRIGAALGLRTLVGLSTLGTLTFSATSASALSASDRAAAQALFDRAKKLMSEGKFADACPALEESQRIEARSGTLLNLADCYEHEGRLATAWSTFLDAAALAAATGNTDREQGARDRAAALASRYSKLVIVLPPAASIEGIEITRDGDPVGRPQLGLPLPADSGSHVVAAKAPGRKPWRTTVLVEGGASTATITVPELERIADETAASAAAANSVTARPAQAENNVAATPPAAIPAAATSEQQPRSMDADAGREDKPAEAPRRYTGGVIAGAAVTGLLAAGTIVTGLIYGNKLREYDRANEARADDRSERYSQTKALGVANLVLLGGTVVAAGVTVILWARTPSRSTSASLELRSIVGPGLTGLTVGYRQ
jgi:tetratricopeptide (TPR) repeat protein